MARPAIQVQVWNGTRREWCWVLNQTQEATQYPLLIQLSDARRFWVGIHEVSSGRIAGQEVGTRALWDLLRLPEPAMGTHFFY